MNVLIACEESQRVCIEMRRLGHNAFSCDIQPCSGGHPEWHIQGDCLPLIDGDCQFIDMTGGTHQIEGQWDMLIAHPPCTYLTVSANKYYEIAKYGDSARKRYTDRYRAIVFFMQMCLARCERIAVENPVGIMSTAYRKPDQIIQPFMFGDEARKATCLWLKHLPPLMATEIVSPGDILKGGFSVGASISYAKDEHGNILPWNDPRTAIIRSKTFPGIARAMAEQWG